jgi:hypothetical protein
VSTTNAIPGMYASPPVPCNTQLLITWLSVHYGFAIPPMTPFHGRGGVLDQVMRRYGIVAVPTRNEDKGVFPSDLWAHVVTMEKRIRGGQLSLLGVEQPR